MDKSNNLVKNKKGFTLIEMLIVVSIIAFLLVFIIAYLRTQALKGNDAKRKGEMNRIQIALEEYEKDHDCYPPKSLISKGCDPGDWLRPYLDKIPCDETKTKTPYFIEVEETSCPSWYRIYTKLENNKDVDIDELGCTYGCGPEYSYNFYILGYNAPLPLMRLAPETEPPIEDNFYGCINGICQIIAWDSERPGPVCDPNYQSPDCYGRCGPESEECLSWKL